MNKFLQKRINLKTFSGLFLSVILVLWLLVASVLIGLAEDVVTAEPIVNFDKYWAGIFLTLRTDLGIAIFSVITLLGNWQIIVPVLILICYLLIIKNQKLFLMPFIFTVGSATLVTFIGKILISRSRPLGAAITETDWSFPSGHATIAVTFYGYLAYLWIRSLKNQVKRLVVVFTALLIIITIGFSRLYLGAHYFSDVVAGYLVGLLALIAGISLSEWQRLKANQK